MKKSQLKEAIKSEIKSVLSENRYDINDPNSPLGRLNDEYESSGLKGIVDNYGLDVVLMILSSGEYGDRLNESVLSENVNPDLERKIVNFVRKCAREYGIPVYNAFLSIEAKMAEMKDFFGEGKYSLEEMTDEEREDKLQQAKRGGGKEKPLRKLAAIGKKSDEEELKEAIFNEGAVLEDVMIAIDFHLDGEISYAEMSKRVEDLILGNIKPSFKVMNEDEMSDDEMDKKASRGAKKEPIGKEAERLAQVQKFMRQMQDKGIVGKDKKILDTPKYKEEFAKFKADLKKKKLEESI